MSPTLRPLLTIALCSLLGSAACAGELRQKLFNAKSYSGSRDRQYQVFVPSGYTGEASVPMVMVLHGCRQTELNMISETRFKELAERDNFIVVYPFITSYDGFRDTNCWGFFLDQHIHKGGGEVEDLHQIASEVDAEFKIDPNRRYVTGLSSGAGMSVALAVAQSAYFAAAGSVEGLPYSETASSVGFVCANPGIFKPISADAVAMQMEQKQPEEQRQIPVMAIHSRNDCVVNILGSENIRDSWIRRYGLNSSAVATSDCTAKGVACTQTKYGTAQRSIVETIFYDGKRGDFIATDSHYWVGDNSGEFANPTGPSASELQWAFFKAHPFRESQPPSISIASATVAGNSVTVNGTASVSTGSIASVTVRLDGRFPQPSKTASGTSNWNVTFDNLPSDAFYVPVATAKDNDGATTGASGNPVAVGSPPPNLSPSVMINSASVSGDCVTVAGNASDPEGQLASVQVELGTRGPKSAALNQNNFRYQECALPAGNYSTKAQAIDNAGARSPVASGPDVSVSGLQSVTANWQVHMSAGRLRVYMAPCANVGFGACDQGFSAIFLANQFSPFPLHRKATSNDWFVGLENVR
ncbi:PHB depolymerase family esterase [Bradyrhizobium erythrophlei]|uniref:extracellular catalytic domain type 1 short-chain-length polyhydroxyalkanoate depolymerase n=1 Tax=Bradyrhizobium erythrophlei TaxID=1437360 RepID=UPI0035E9B2D9